MQTALPEAVGSPGLSGESLPARSSYSQTLHCVFLLAGCSPLLSSAASQSDSIKRVTQQFNSILLTDVQYITQISSQVLMLNLLKNIIKGNIDLYVILHK